MLIRLLSPRVSLSYSSALMRWLFALFVALDKPLDANVGSVLTALYRDLAQMRAEMLESQEREVAEVNILLIIIDKTFGQGVR